MVVIIIILFFLLAAISFLGIIAIKDLDVRVTHLEMREYEKYECNEPD